MTLLILGLVLFIGVHVFSAFRVQRQAVITKIGEKSYKGIYSLVSFAGIGLIVLGMRGIQPVYLWAAPAWGYKTTDALMIISFVLIIAFMLPTNIKRLTRHPMSWGVILWAVAHLLSSGKLSSLILFGSLAAYALFAMWSKDRRGIPAAPAKLPVIKDVIVVVVGLVGFGVVRFFHP